MCAQASTRPIGKCQMVVGSGTFQINRVRTSVMRCIAIGADYCDGEHVALLDCLSSNYGLIAGAARAELDTAVQLKNFLDKQERTEERHVGKEWGRNCKIRRG